MGETTRVAKWDNLKFILIYLVVLGHFIGYFKKIPPFFKGLYFFIYLFHMPAFFFISGMFSKRKIDKRKYEQIIPYFFLYLFIKAFRYVIFSLSNRKWGDFKIFDGRSEGWFALVLFFSYLITIFLSNYQRSYLMILAISVGVMAGYDKEVGNYLAGLRLFTMYPFFLAGYFTDVKKLTEFTSQKRIKLIAGVVLVVAFAVCLRWGNRLYGYAPLLKARESYFQLGLWPSGGLYRGIYYLTAFLLIFCVMIVIPSRGGAVHRHGEENDTNICVPPPYYESVG